MAIHIREVSSVGLERRLDRAEVMGSNPLLPTIKKPGKLSRLFILQPSGLAKTLPIRGFPTNALLPTVNMITGHKVSIGLFSL